MSDLHTYFASLNSRINRKDGAQLASLLALPLHTNSTNFQPSSVEKQLSERASGINCLSYASSNINDENVSIVVGYRLLAFVSYMKDDVKRAYEHELAAYNAILECIKEDGSTWIQPVLYRISNDLRLLAMKADSQSSNNDFLRNSLENLTKGFTAIAKDRTPITTPGSKRVGIFAVTNVLFKIYFKVNTLQLCSKLISVVEGSSGVIDNLHLYPVTDVVTYKYYIGRLKLFEDKHDDARDNLRYALKHTPIECMVNRQRILASLVPVEMCLGVMPTQLVASKYGFNEYVAMGNAVKVGDVRTFEEILSTHQKSFIRIGVYLVLEQVKSIAYRSLFKKIYTLTSSTRVNMSTCTTVLQWLGEDVDMDEIECIIANLIYSNRIKGYISHQKRVLVLSKADPFPTASVTKKTKS